MSRILVADDNEQLCNALQRTLTKSGYQAEVAFDGVEAVDKIEGSFFDLLLTDLKMPKLDGMKVLKKAKEISPATVVIVVTAYGTVENAVEALREGAFDYVLKPFDSDELELKIKRALEQQRLSLENVLLNERGLPSDRQGVPHQCAGFDTGQERYRKGTGSQRDTQEEHTGRWPLL